MNEWKYEHTDFDSSYYFKSGRDFLFVVMQNTSSNPDNLWDISYSKNGMNHYVKNKQGGMLLFESPEEAMELCVYCYKNDVDVYDR